MADLVTSIVISGKSNHNARKMVGAVVDEAGRKKSKNTQYNSVE